jgi:hypothetical protein
VNLTKSQKRFYDAFLNSNKRLIEMKKVFNYIGLTFKQTFDLEE